MNPDLTFYIACILIAIVGFLVFKKVTSCLLKTALTIVAVVILAAIYFMYIK